MRMEKEPSLPHRKIPATGESIPVLGLGTWKCFDVGPGAERNRLREVLDALTRAGATVIDTSPMYGQAEETLGTLLPATGPSAQFIATKVWTRGRAEGVVQMEKSLSLLGRKSVDLMQVHNLVDWQAHVPVLREWKAAGRIRYWGLTHYKASEQAELERVAAAEKPDFIQINYSLEESDADIRLLPFAADHGIAVLANRPFGEGALFRKYRDRELPAAARAAGIDSWSALFLDHVLSHPAVTCAIPATGNPAHLAENVASAIRAASGAVPRRDWRKLIS